MWRSGLLDVERQIQNMGTMVTSAVIVRLRWLNDSVLGGCHALAANNNGLSAAISYGPPVRRSAQKDTVLVCGRSMFGEAHGFA